MSLRTTLENEQRAMDAVLEACPSDVDLYEISTDKLAKLVRPAGMPDKKATTIKKALNYCRESYGDDFETLLAMDEEAQRAAVDSIPGFGPKSRDCFLSIGLGVSTAVVDINVFRAFAHLTADAELSDFGNAKQVETVRASIDEALPQEPFLRQIVHTLLLLYGKDRFGTDQAGVCVVAGDCKTCRPLVDQRARLFA